MSVNRLQPAGKMTRLVVDTLLVWMLGVVPALAGSFVVYPAEVTLTGPEGRQKLLVQSLDGDRIGPQVASGVRFTSSNDQVVRIVGNQLIAAGNGVAHITIQVGGDSQQLPVRVQDFDRPHQWSFRNQVQSILSKAGCNMGACHGAAAGKNGFRLSLRGYDPEADFQILTRQARGRRIVPHDPGRSLILTKPTGAIPHQGGLRFSEDSEEYRVLSEWIAQGTPGPTADDVRIQKLEILPPITRLPIGQTQQLIVRAHFSDGHAEDVTSWAKFTSTNHSVAQVSDDGRVTVSGSGEGAIVAWYLAQNVTATVTSPYQQEIADTVWQQSPVNNLIDEFVLAKLRDLNVPPSARCQDGEFLRRATLDTIGTLPSVAETQAFLAETDPQKRVKLIDQLLNRPEFVDYWTYQWSDLLLVSGKRLRPKAVDTYSAWIRERVARNQPWNEFAREVVTAKGSTFENGAANFYALHQDPFEMSETVSMAFLGMSIGCARCHDHPLEKWTNDDYYGLASMFARVRGKGWGGDFRGGDGLRVVFLADRGELIQPRTGRPQPPRPLEGQPIPFETTADRREAFADWLVSPENPYFSRAIVNRIWANFLGVGLVEKVDDLRLTNPPSHPELMEALASELVRQQFDVKSLMRLILNSETYQRSSNPLPENAADERYYARFFPRRLKAEILLDAVAEVTGVPTEFKDYPAGTRALQVRDTSLASYFLDTFGRPERLLTCTCERSDAPSMTQVLHLANGPTLLTKLEHAEGRISRWLTENRSNEEILEELYLSAFCRVANANERTTILDILQSTPASERRAALEDLTWGVLTSREFLFQH